jgi:hypothetical protein
MKGVGLLIHYSMPRETKLLFENSGNNLSQNAITCSLQ